jgi:hypothetical protein
MLKNIQEEEEKQPQNQFSFA